MTFRHGDMMNFSDDLVIRCLRCGQKNRIPGSAVSFRPLCGKCGASLDELIIRCLNCGTRNLVSEDRLEDRPKCGRCGTPLCQGTSTELAEASFQNEILYFPGPALVCLWAPWCVTCRVLVPVFDRIAPAYAGGVKMVKMELEKNPAVAKRYGVEKTPAFLFFRNGRLEEKITGIVTGEELKKHIRILIRGKDIPR